MVLMLNENGLNSINDGKLEDFLQEDRRVILNPVWLLLDRNPYYSGKSAPSILLLPACFFFFISFSLIFENANIFDSQH